MVCQPSVFFLFLPQIGFVVSFYSLQKVTELGGSMGQEEHYCEGDSILHFLNIHP